MSGYFGSEAQRALQARVVESADWMQATPGASIGGRFMWCDDIDRLGWDTIERLLDRDGVFGFRMLPVGRVAAVSARLSERGFRADRWNVFVGDRGTALAASNRVLDNPLPSGVSAGSFPRDPESDEMIAVQAFMSGSGIVPFPGIMLAGDLCPSTGVTLLDGGTLVATAYSYLPHNASSRYRSYAWGGLACVSEGYRGRALGTFVNALMVVKAFDELDADWIYEMISETNLPSRRMAEACGLAIEPSLTTCVAVRAGEPRFTR
jgi:hypothetical protein